MRTSFARSALLAVAIIAMVTSGCGALRQDLTPGRIPAPEPFQGVWDGAARVIVSTYDNNHIDSVNVRLRILPDGNVMGSIGNAAIRRGYLSQNRGWLGKFFYEETNYMVAANLVGELSEGTNLKWGSAAIPLTLRDGVIRGEIHVRSSEDMDNANAVQFSATDMELRPE